MSNWTRKLIKKNNQRYLQVQIQAEKKRKDQFIQSALPAISFTVVFFFDSFTNSTNEWSFHLALFSFSVTMTFEFNEWSTYFCEKYQKTNKHHISKPLLAALNDWNPILLCVVLEIILAFFFRCIRPFQYVNEEFQPNISNILSSFTLLVYFFSYSARFYLSKFRKHGNKK